VTGPVIAAEQHPVDQGFQQGALVVIILSPVAAAVTLNDGCSYLPAVRDRAELGFIDSQTSPAPVNVKPPPFDVGMPPVVHVRGLVAELDEVPVQRGPYTPRRGDGLRNSYRCQPRQIIPRNSWLPVHGISMHGRCPAALPGGVIVAGAWVAAGGVGWASVVTGKAPL